MNILTNGAIIIIVSLEWYENKNKYYYILSSYLSIIDLNKKQRKTIIISMHSKRLAVGKILKGFSIEMIPNGKHAKVYG